ncbi:MAG: PspA/IM30 family protein [Alphaproteobacteria bacterium]|jgi:phage shock protein A|nr:phage shock protein A [Rhodospirillaceae bacterium]MDP6021960.1 PspA/IM30 family protein [Alphaproteobacteria bacterium]MDP7055702.1 PspA/IM30 family protein [Alphaproteobacteria bacterium]MDP7229335.1 PspA/IM30 family protein [Alphaproteobacteria bacterium]|tara:strand:- start:21 stop:713 length:693 start_codon:yes stop_codon:yes gene_type:complete
MSIWAKVATAIRGGASEAGEAIVDNQALRILDQEIRDADNGLSKSKGALTGIIAKRKLADKKVGSLKSSLTEYDGYAMQALDKGDDSLAVEIAEKIAGLETELLGEEGLAKSFADSEGQLRKTVAQTEANLKRLKQQVDTVKATEVVQKSQAAVAARHSGVGSSMGSALESLERLKTKQAERAAKFEAASELAESTEEVSLDAKLKAAGIVDGGASGGDVLARLKAKRGG